ncbi:MAG: hypothetical protein JWL71_1217 [Acidobacteria bacterium]|nr:hypothetical protein [Acidobacteriota bacterium]
MAEAAPLSSGPAGSALYLAVTQRVGSGFAIDAALDVDLRPGGTLVLFGPSGAGKTTLLRHIAGLERPDVGTIRFGAETWCDTARRVWQTPQSRRIGLVFQHSALFPHLTVRKNITYGVKVTSGPGPSDRVRPGSDRDLGGAGISAMLGVEALGHRYPRSLSGGEAQRVALARALAPAPRLLLLDEPFASLDAPTRLRLRRDLRALLQTTGTPAILVTHDRAEALAMGDLVAVMIGGRIRQVGSVSDVFSRPADAEIAASLGIEAVLPAQVAGSSDGVIAVAVGRVTLHAAEREPLAAGTAVYACVRAEDVTLETRASGHASTRNHLAARVVSIASEGPIARVTLDCGFPLDALITRRSCDELNLSAGAQVTAAIKATSIHLVPRM